MIMANNSDRHTDNKAGNNTDRVGLDDPLEALLQQAFSEQLSQPTDEAAISRITARIAFEQKIRTLVMMGLIAIGAVLGISVLLPAITQLLSTLSLPEIPGVAGHSPATAIAGLVLLGLVPWLVDLADDQI